MDRKVGNSDKCIKCRKIIIGKCKRSSTPYLVWGIIYYERNLAIYDIIQVNIVWLLAMRFLSASIPTTLLPHIFAAVQMKSTQNLSIQFRWYFVGIVDLIGSAYK